MFILWIVRIKSSQEAGLFILVLFPSRNIKQAYIYQRGTSWSFLSPFFPSSPTVGKQVKPCDRLSPSKNIILALFKLTFFCFFRRRENKEKRAYKDKGYSNFMQKNQFFKKIRKGHFEFPENSVQSNYLITWDFHKRFRGQSKNQILKEVFKISKIILDTNPKTYKQKRRRHHAVGKKCFICKKNKCTSQHHLVLLKNGGADTSWNRIQVCPDCHKQIHPWM